MLRGRIGRVLRRVAVSSVVLAATSCVAADPAPLAADEPGGAGACTVASRREVANPAQWQYPTVVLEPGGSGRAVDGGRCDDAARPVILFGHGYSATFTEGYDAFLRHLVSRGFVIVYPAYQLAFDPPQQYDAELGGLLAGLAATDRADTSRFGLVGHSWGAGMGPWMLQEIAARGWGRRALWSVLFAPAFPLRVGTGPIELPSNLRLLVVNFDEDVFVDARIGDELTRSVQGPETPTRHLLIRSDRDAWPFLVADHTVPVTLGTTSDTGLDLDHLDRHAVWRPVDATAACSLTGTWCDVDLADMGVLADGHEVRDATWLGPYDDVGPPAILECDSILRIIATRSCA